jgi:sigma-B regulation protein RsbU (phosphoserine phosphatase)
LDDDDRTQIMTSSARPAYAADDRVHFVELVNGLDGRRHVIDPLGATVGRKAPAEIVLVDSEISRAHCRLVLKDDLVWVSDLGSTNGTFLNGEQVSEPVVVPMGAILQVGRQLLKYEWRSRREWALSHELDRDLETASGYVHALLPAQLTEGRVHAEWLFQPSTKLGGDAFGYGWLPDGRFVCYLVDVSGHGAGAAMHSVAVMNVLRQRALPGADMTSPAQVLSALNRMFQMDDHAGMYFTMWYGVFDPASRRLEFASAGHHPAYLVGAERDGSAALRTRNMMIGAMPDLSYKQEGVQLPEGASIFLFSDGVFEIVTNDGQQWTLQDFLPLLLKPPSPETKECRRLFDEVTSVARPGGFDDDFSIVVLTFH